LVALLGIFLLASSICAQDVPGIKFGIKGGVNLANVAGDDAGESDMLLGFAGGVFVQVPMGPLTFQPEAHFTMKGAKSSSTMDIMGTLYDTEEKIKLTYIEVPMLFKYKLQTAGNMAPCFFVGPAVALNMGAKYEISINDESADVDIYNKKDIDFGIVFGAGVDFAMGTKTLSLDARYTMGLTAALDDVDSPDDIPDDEVAFVDDDGKGLDIKNTNIQVMVGISF